MSYYEIQGGRPLGGALAVHGAKNSVLPILAACLLVPDSAYSTTAPTCPTFPPLWTFCACWAAGPTGRVTPSSLMPRR